MILKIALITGIDFHLFLLSKITQIFEIYDEGAWEIVRSVMFCCERACLTVLNKSDIVHFRRSLHARKVAHFMHVFKKVLLYAY